MRTFGYLAAAAMTALVTTLAMASPAVAAGEVLTYDSNLGPTIPVGDTLTSGLKSGTVATFYSTTAGSTGVTCTSSTFAAEVTSNPPAPGTATERLDAQTFSGCTTNVFGTTSVKKLEVLNLPYNASVNSNNQVTITGSIRTRIVLGTFLGDITCEYIASSVKGTASDTDNSITFTDQPFTKALGPSTCFGTSYLDATYAPVVGDGGRLVFVN